MWLLSLSWVDIILIVGVYSLATIVQSATGFGSTVVAGPFLALIDPRFVPGPLLLAGVTIAVLILFRDGPAGDKIDVFLVTGGRFLGSLLGAFLLVQLTRTSLTLLFSGLLLLAACMSAIGLTVKRSRPTMAAAGVVSGTMGVVAGLGGAPVALMFQSERGANLRSKLATYLLPGGLVSVATIAIAGRLTAYELELYVLLLPGLAIGHIVTTAMKTRLDRYVSKWLVLSITTAGSGWLLFKTLSGM